METIQRPQPGFAKTVSVLGFGVALMQLVSWLGFNGIFYLSHWLGLPLSQGGQISLLLWSDLALYGMGLPCLLGVGLLLPGGAVPLRPTRPLSLPAFGRLACICYAGGYLANLVSLFLVGAARLVQGVPPYHNPVQGLLESIPPLAAFVLMSLVPALGEELVFRGFFYKKLARFGPRAYILISALFFATYHGNLNQLLYAFVLGLVLAFVAWRTGSIVYGILLHFLFNFTSACVVVPLQASVWATSLLGLGVALVTGLGLVFAFRLRRGLRFEKSPATGPHLVAGALLNPGMLTWLICAAWMVVMGLIV